MGKGGGELEKPAGKPETGCACRIMPASCRVAHPSRAEATGAGRRNHAMPEAKPPREPQAVSCMKCIYHFITYDPAFPYGCRAMNFKSRQLPQYEVFGASRQTCQYFSPRERKGEV